MAFEYIPGETFFHKLDGRSKIFFLICMTFLVIFIFDPFIIGLILLSLILIYKLSKIPMKKLWSIAKSLIPAFILFFIMNFLWAVPPAGAKVYFYLIPPEYVPVTIEGAMIGITNVLRFFFFIALARLITFITPITDLILSFVHLKLPPEFGIALSSGFAHIPVFIKEFSDVIDAQKARAARFEFRNPIKRMKALSAIIVPAVFLSLRRAGQLASAIEARGFSYNIANRTYRVTIKLRENDYVFMIANVSITAVVAILRYYFGCFGYTFIWDFIKQFLPLP